MSEVGTTNSGRRSLLADTAIDWVVRVEAKDASDDDLNAFGEWLAADPRHGQAYEEADRLWRRLGSAINRRDLAAYRARKPSRLQDGGPGSVWHRSRHRWSIAAACAATVLVLASPWLVELGSPVVSKPVQQIYTSGVGATTSITLDDGTAVILGAASTMTATLSADLRSVALTSGEAYFDVAADVDRPFFVAADALRIRVTGTEFDVQRKGRVTQVAVAEGSVRVSHPAVLGPRGSDAGGSVDPITVNQTLTLTAGERVLAVRDQGLGAVGTIKPERIGAWRQDRLVYLDVPLEAIVADLNRYDARTIRVVDRAAAEIEVSATFDGSDVDSVLTSLTELFPVAIAREPDGNLMLRYRPRAPGP